MKHLTLIISLIFFSACNFSDLKEQKEYYANGNLKTIFFKDKVGRLQGKYKIYFNNGKINQIRYYKNNLLNGNYLVYDETGKFRKKFKFKNDKEIDTSFYFNKYEKLEVYAVYNENSEELKNVFFYPNGNLKEIKTFIVGRGEINAFKSFTEEGKPKTKYMESKYAIFQSTVEGSILPIFIGLKFDTHDSIVMTYVKNFDYSYNQKAHIIRKATCTDLKDLKLNLLNGDYTNGKANVLVELWTKVSPKEISVQSYKFQFDKGRELSKNSLYPIYLKW